MAKKQDLRVKKRRKRESPYQKIRDSLQVRRMHRMRKASSLRPSERSAGSLAGGAAGCCALFPG